MCCLRLAGNTRRKNRQKIAICKAYIDNWEKNLLNNNISPTRPYNIVNFGPLAAEIFSLVWGTPGNFNGFRFLAALLHGTAVSQTLRR